ncbi:MAG TPA: fibronectin type III domain-containing protein, partial [Saprospiraceae bacterium]|nr:fibronectin type III domain-containing protein [Saprospiraceae bacterium]
DTLWNIDSDTYIDQIAELNKSYQYKIRAVDSVANKSIFSPLKSGVIKVTAKNTGISQLSIKQKEKSKAVEVSWQVEMPKNLSTTAFTVEIYRSSGQDGIKHYKKMDKDLDVFTDNDLQSGVLYNYAVRVRYENGWTSELSEIKSILIK